MVVALALVFPAFAGFRGSVLLASDWPQWRGQNGSGVSSETGLPEHWGPQSPEIVWRVRIPGNARSSPILSGNRIFLTTAVPDLRTGRMFDVLALLLVGIAMLRFTWRPGAHSAPSDPVPAASSQFAGFRSLTEWTAWLLFGCVTACCLANDFEEINKAIGPFRLLPVLALLLAGTTAPSSLVDSAYARGRWLIPGVFPALFASTALIMYVAGAPSRYVHFAVGLGLIQPLVWRLDSDRQKLGGPLQFENYFLKYSTFVLLTIAGVASLNPNRFWSDSVDANIWTRATVILLVGLTFAIGWFQANSYFRCIGSATLLFSAYLLFHYTPLTSTVLTIPVHAHFDVDYAAWKRGLAVAPGIVGAVWHATIFLFSRRTTDLASRRNPWFAGALAGLAIVLFVRATMASPAKRMAFTVMALDAESGNVLWDTVVSRGPLGRIEDHRASGASPTPCTDGSSVFAHFGGVTARLDYKGHVRWKQTDSQHAASVVYGAASSPILVDDRLIVVQDREHLEQARKSYVAAYQKSSGQILWRVEPADARNSYGTPLALLGGQPTLVTITSQALLSYDLRNGNRLWSLPVPVEEIVTSMVLDGNRLYISGGSFTAATVALQLRVGSNAVAPEVLWSTNRGGHACASPVYYHDKLFTLSEDGIASCYDGATGARHWRRRLATGEYCASLTGADGKIYATSEEGVTTVFEAGTKFNILGQNDLGEPAYSSPAIGRGSIFLRTDNALYCIRK